MKEEIAVVGSLNMDLVTKVKRRPTNGETIIGKGFFTSPGGKGGNQAFAAAKLGGNVRMIESRGGPPRTGTAFLSSRVSGFIDSVYMDTNETSGVAVIIVDDDANNSIIVIPGANNKLSAKNIRELRPYIANAKLLIVQLEIPLESAMQSIDIAVEHHIPVLLDPSPVPEGGVPAEILQKVSYLTPNVTELQQLSGIQVSDYESVVRASQILSTRGFNVYWPKWANRGLSFPHSVKFSTCRVFTLKPRHHCCRGCIYWRFCGKLSKGSFFAGKCAIR